MTQATTTTGANFEPGYKAVLVCEETKDRLRELRGSLPDRDLCQERRLATAALEMVLDQASTCEETRNKLVARTHEIVMREISKRSSQQP